MQYPVNRSFLRSLRDAVGDEMFGYDVAKTVYVDHGHYEGLTWMSPVKRMMHAHMDQFMKANVENTLLGAVQQGLLIRICPGWFMFPIEE